MIKLLINCSFTHYPHGTYQRQNHFALIVTVPDTEDRVEITKLICDELVILGFNLPDKRYWEAGSIDFTAQKI